MVFFKPFWTSLNFPFPGAHDPAKISIQFNGEFLSCRFFKAPEIDFSCQNFQHVNCYLVNFRCFVLFAIPDSSWIVILESQKDFVVTGLHASVATIFRPIGADMVP